MFTVRNFLPENVEIIQIHRVTVDTQCSYAGAAASQQKL